MGYPASTEGSAMELLPRERQVLQRIWDDVSHKDIAQELGVSLRRVDHIVRMARCRLGGGCGTIGLLRKCVAAGVLTP